MSEKEAETEAPPSKSSKASGIVGKLVTGLGLFALVFTAQLGGMVTARHLVPDAASDARPAANASEDELDDELEDEEEFDEFDLEPPIYLPLDPPLVVSIETESAVRFLQVSVEVMARDPAVIEAVKAHNPVIRNNLLLLLHGLAIDELDGRDGKQMLRDQALAEVQTVLEEQIDDPGIENLYFTSFVIQ